MSSYCIIMINPLLFFSDQYRYVVNNYVININWNITWWSIQTRNTFDVVHARRNLRDAKTYASMWLSFISTFYRTWIEAKYVPTEIWRKMIGQLTLRNKWIYPGMIKRHLVKVKEICGSNSLKTTILGTKLQMKLQYKSKGLNC